MHEYDIIVVGQGMAGTAITRRLMKRGKRVLVFDRNVDMTSSKIAAGLVNPITGRRFVKSWNFEVFNAEALAFYREWEQDIGVQLVYPLSIIRAVEDRRFIDDVEAKTMDPHYADYIEFNLPEDDSCIIPSDISYEIKNAYRVNWNNILLHTRDILIQRDSILFESFDYSKLNVLDNEVRYGKCSAEYIIFCEGASCVANPWFGHLPFQPTKGELFELKESNAPDYAYKRDLILIPIGEDALWCGALSFWNYNDALPSEEGESILLQKLKKFYRPTPFIHQHLAAIRPTVRDRRPLLGKHDVQDRLVIFNGLGTKGTLLAPFFSSQLVQHIYEGHPLMPEVDIHRFKKKN